MVVTQFSGKADNPVAGYKKSHGVFADNPSDSPAGPGIMDCGGYISVSRQSARRNPEQGFPDLQLEIRAFQVQLYGRRLLQSCVKINKAFCWASSAAGVNRAFGSSWPPPHLASFLYVRMNSIPEKNRILAPG